eukprot:gnl/Hemi2/26371_TR8853_c0_g1_i1.p1 gnl/Hemi2/26371_TR8853_c0_g1~~gnl/Hemi2/26371_TR8853_c0_g1_i1.p1  ORF type:complete len:163 (+),score=85.58 gnl/Hemi2/26371_TR8853_c0_g1_i1:50-490(+)
MLRQLFSSAAASTVLLSSQTTSLTARCVRNIPLAVNKHVKVVLLADVPHLGKEGQEVSVKPGFARNYLVPSGFARQLPKRTQPEQVMHELRQERRMKRLEKEAARRVAALLSAQQAGSGATPAEGEVQQQQQQQQQQPPPQQQQQQ